MKNTEAIGIIKAIAKHASDSGLKPALDIVDATAAAVEALKGPQQGVAITLPEGATAVVKRQNGAYVIETGRAEE